MKTFFLLLIFSVGIQASTPGQEGQRFSVVALGPDQCFSILSTAALAVGKAIQNFALSDLLWGKSKESDTETETGGVSGAEFSSGGDNDQLQSVSGVRRKKNRQKRDRENKKATDPLVLSDLDDDDMMVDESYVSSSSLVDKGKKDK